MIQRNVARIGYAEIEPYPNNKAVIAHWLRFAEPNGRLHAQCGPSTNDAARTLGVSSLGFGQRVLAHLLAGTSEAKPTPIYNDLRARPGHLPARAKAVIQLVQNGGPSQMDLFDPKPVLAKYAVQPLPDRVEIPPARQH